MSNPYSSGPVYVWVGLTQAVIQNSQISYGDVAALDQGLVGGVGGFATAVVTSGLTAWSTVIQRLVPVYLGTGHFAPSQKHRRYFAEVINDMSGPKKTHDKMYVGQDALVGVALTDWREPVYQAIASLPNFGRTDPGRDPVGAMGTLMLTEGMAYPVYLRYPNTDLHAAMRITGQPPGYRYIACHLEGDDDAERGTRENVRHIMWYAHSVHQPDGGHSCYDYNMAGIPAVPPPSDLG